MNGDDPIQSGRYPFAENNPAPAQLGTIKALCGACGLCCNGVLFGDVKLQTSDSVSTLKSHGIDLKKRGKSVYFRQPCTALNGTSCSIYQDRPAMCRAFECQLLKKLLAGDSNLEKALSIVEKTRSHVGRVEIILSRFESAQNDRPLNFRCAKVMRQPIDLQAVGAAKDPRANLLIEVSRLTRLLSLHFLGNGRLR